MALSFYLSLSDTLPTLSVTFTQPSGTVVNLTGYTVVLRLRHQATGTTAGPFTMTVSAPLTGVATYTFGASDITLAEGWDYQATATNGAVVLHLPNDGLWEQMWVSPVVQSQTGTHAYYPTSASLWRYLEGHGLTVSTAGFRPLLASMAAAGVADFERRANRKLLAGTTDIQKRFDPPTAWIDGQCELFIPDLVSLTSLVYTPTNGTSTTLTEGTDFDLLPSDATDADALRPFTSIAFYNRRWTNPLAPSLRRSLYLTGKWGYASAVPADAYEGMLAGAAVSLWTSIRHTSTGGILSWSDGDRKVDYGVETWRNLVSQWEALRDRAVMNYRKIRL